MFVLIVIFLEIVEIFDFGKSKISEQFRNLDDSGIWEILENLVELWGIVGNLNIVENLDNFGKFWNI